MAVSPLGKRITENTMSAEQYFKCPKCGYSFDTEDLVADGLITLWAEDGRKDVECPECEAELRILEAVTRDWDVASVNEK